MNDSDSDVIDASKPKKTKKDDAKPAKPAKVKKPVPVFCRAVYEYLLEIEGDDSTSATYVISKIVVGDTTAYEIVRRTPSRDMPIGTFSVSDGAVTKSDSPNPKLHALCAAVATLFCDGSDARSRTEKLRDRKNPEIAAQRRLEQRGQQRISGA